MQNIKYLKIVDQLQNLPIKLKDLRREKYFKNLKETASSGLYNSLN